MSILKGLCVSRGNAAGTAYIIRENDTVPDDLPKNTILVTDALCRDLVRNLSSNVVGVVAEHGNIGSHGAGILRQLKIPCIIRIPHITDKLQNGITLEICGSDNCVRIDSCSVDNYNVDYSGDPELRYQDISKDTFSKADIRIRTEWVCLRPKRFYHKLRYDMISDAFAQSCSFLYGTPEGKTRLNSYGAIDTYGIPYICDICSFVLSNPDWFLSKARERSNTVDTIKLQLSQLIPYTQAATVENIETVFDNGVKLYQSLFRYSFLSQFIADELLEVYLDFIRNLTGIADTKDILSLHSTYVQESLSTAEKLGDAQRWLTEQHAPQIWSGSLDASPLPPDPTIMQSIAAHPTQSKKMQLDYDAFRVIIPLVYQMAEEFFYLSSSIHSFVTWSISHIYEQLRQANLICITLSEFYECSLNDVSAYLKQLKELTING